MKTLKRLRALMRPARNMEREALKTAYRSVFSGPAGQRVLEDICTGLKQSLPTGKDAAATADARAFQDGREEVMLHIIRMLDE